MFRMATHTERGERGIRFSLLCPPCGAPMPWIYVDESQCNVGVVLREEGGRMLARPTGQQHPPVSSLQSPGDPTTLNYIVNPGCHFRSLLHTSFRKEGTAIRASQETSCAPAKVMTGPLEEKFQNKVMGVVRSVKTQSVKKRRRPFFLVIISTSGSFIFWLEGCYAFNEEMGPKTGITLGLVIRRLAASTWRDFSFKLHWVIVCSILKGDTLLKHRPK